MNLFLRMAVSLFFGDGGRLAGPIKPSSWAPLQSMLTCRPENSRFLRRPLRRLLGSREGPRGVDEQ